MVLVGKQHHNARRFTTFRTLQSGNLLHLLQTHLSAYYFRLCHYPCFERSILVCQTTFNTELIFAKKERRFI